MATEMYRCGHGNDDAEQEAYIDDTCSRACMQMAADSVKVQLRDNDWQRRDKALQSAIEQMSAIEVYQFVEECHPVGLTGQLYA